jgi:hypothetical protein
MFRDGHYTDASELLENIYGNGWICQPRMKPFRKLHAISLTRSSVLNLCQEPLATYHTCHTFDGDQINESL